MRAPAFVLVAGLALAASPVLAQGKPDPEAIFNTGLVHLREGRSDLALDAFKQAIKGDSKNPYFHKGLGQAYLALRRYGDAISAFRKALDLNQYYVDVRNDLGTALVLSGKREEGRKEFLAAFNDPTNPTPEISARNLGQAFLEDKNYAEAATWFQTSMNRNKSYPDAYLLYSDALVAMGKPEEAVAGMELAVKSIPDDPSILLGLGQVYYRAGRFTEARTRLEQAAQKDPAGVSGRRAAELLRNFPK